MVIALKILLFALMIACGLSIRFFYKEFKGVLKSKEFDESSIFDRFIIYLMTFGSSILLVSIMIFCCVVLLCELTIIFPNWSF